MASASSEPLTADPTADHERVAALQAELQRSEQRREAAEAWAEFLESELKARDKRLEEVIARYETLLADAKSEEHHDTDDGLWAKLKNWF